jgi:hypothetical protein
VRDSAGIGRRLVHVLDARMSYGRPHLQIQPLSGQGHRWIDADLTQPVED